MAFTNPQGRTQSSLADINITPLVDVVLVLLIIFMLTTPVLQSGIDVAVPKTRTVKEVTQQRAVLTIKRDQTLYLSFGGADKAVNIHDIPAIVHGRVHPDQAVYVRADENIPFGLFASVMDSLKQGGITNISVVTQPLTENSK
ncbi:MAG TPA: biopolymer transporter ExbD [Terriglobales bacterium]|nr:biopolymer transporter ExbD [Terriglobales bacterium]